MTWGWKKDYSAMETVGGKGGTEERVIRKERDGEGGGRRGGRAGEINGRVDRKMSEAREQHCVAYCRQKD